MRHFLLIFDDDFFCKNRFIFVFYNKFQNIKSIVHIYFRFRCPEKIDQFFENWYSIVIIFCIIFRCFG
jgi:hypothetical protein